MTPMPSHNYALHRLEMIDWRQFPLYKQKGTPNPVFPYFMISILVKVAISIFDLFLDVLQRKQYFEPEPPKEIMQIAEQLDKESELKQSDETDENEAEPKKSLVQSIRDTFEKNQEYNKEKSLFSIIHSIVDLILSIFMLLMGIEPYFWDLSKQITLWLHLPQTNYLYVSILLVVDTILDTLLEVPFSLYSTFVIEAKYGFNTQTYSLFFMDLIKSNAINIIVSILLYMPIIYITERMSDSVYIYLFITFTLFTIIFNLLYPTVIMPLFNKMEPLEDGPLKTRLDQLCTQCHFNCKNMSKIDESKRTTKGNAAAYGLFGNNGILLYDNIIKQLSNDEIAAVLGHEIGHWRYGHVYINLLLQSVIYFFIFYFFHLYTYNEDLYHNFGYVDTCPFIGLELFMQVFFAPFSTFTSFLSTILSRQMEYAADRYSCHLGYGQLLKKGLYKIYIDNSSSFNPHWFVSFMRNSHPTLLERCHAIDDYEKKNN